jgi:hypothetical protein
MSVYVVNVKEPCNGNKALCEIAQVFKGNIFHRETTYGSLMVHEENGVTPDQQRNSIRAYFASRAMPVSEWPPTDTGHVIFEVDLTTSGRIQAAVAVEDQKATQKMAAPSTMALAA